MKTFKKEEKIVCYKHNYLHVIKKGKKDIFENNKWRGYLKCWRDYLILGSSSPARLRLGYINSQIFFCPHRVDSLGRTYEELSFLPCHSSPLAYSSLCESPPPPPPPPPTIFAMYLASDVYIPLSYTDILPSIWSIPSFVFPPYTSPTTSVPHLSLSPNLIISHKKFIKQCQHNS